MFDGQTRQTRSGKLIKFWKFRIMYRNAAELPSELAEKNICDGPEGVIRDGLHAIRVVQILRRFQIDEFRQLCNVLLGQLNVVGSRPSPDQSNQHCPAWQASAERSALHHRALAAQPEAGLRRGLPGMDPICRKTILVLLKGGAGRCG